VPITLVHTGIHRTEDK